MATIWQNHSHLEGNMKYILVLQFLLILLTPALAGFPFKQFIFAATRSAIIANSTNTDSTENRSERLKVPRGSTIEAKYKYQDGTYCNCDAIDKRYYKSGALWFEMPYVNGKPQGTVMVYFESGTIRSERPYVDGRMHGMRKDFFESGALKRGGSQ